MKLTLLPLSLILIALFAGSVAVSCTAVHGAGEGAETPEIQNAEQQLKEAFMAVREAEAAGAERNKIALSIEKLNSALNLIEQARRDYGQGNLNASEPAGQSAYISSQVKAEVDQLKNSALASSLYTRILVFVLVPVAALIVALCVRFGLKRLRRGEGERLMRMEIAEK